MTQQKGFTLIELLIVIGIIAILAAVTFVALDPLTRFADARDARRWTDVDATLSALKLYQVDNDGSHLASVTAGPVANPGVVFSICDGGGCTDPQTVSGTDCTFAGNNTVDLSGLVPSYIADVPQDPGGAAAVGDAFSGYALTYSGGVITIQSCYDENDTVTISR